VAAVTTSAEAVTMLALAPGAERIGEVLRAWTEARLLRPSIWLDASRLREHRPGDDVEVRVVGPDGTDTRPLRTALGDTPYRVVRLVAVRPVTADTPDDLSAADLNEFSEEFNEILPMRTDLVRINLVVPDSPQVRAASRFEPGWDMNVVVSPEDRPSEDAIDHGVQRSEVYPAHGALACATVGALWWHLPGGAFDTGGGPTASNHGRLVVTRSSVRLVDGRTLPDRVVGELVREGVMATLPDMVDRGQGAVARDDALIWEAAQAYLSIENRALDFHPYRPPRPAPMRPVFPHTARTLAYSVLQLSHVRVMEWRNAGVGRLEAATENWLDRAFGQDAEPRDPLLWGIPPTPQEIREMAYAGTVSDRADARPGDRAVTLPGLIPSGRLRFLWLPLRQLSFGLLDRGPMPEEVQEHLGTLTPRASHPRWIVPAPEDAFFLTEEEREALRAAGHPARGVRAADPNAAQHLQVQVRRAAQAVASGRDAPPEAPPGAASQTLAECERRLDAWLARQHHDSLFGRLTDHVNEQLRLAHEEIMKRARQYKKDEDERKRLVDELERARDHLDRRPWTALVGLGAAVGFAVDVALQPPWFEYIALAAGIAGLGVLLWWIFRILFFVLVGVRLERELEEVERRRRATMAAVRQWPAEADRLASVYEVLTDWGEIIGWMLHRPFGATAGADTAAGMPGPPLPEAFRFGEGQVSREHFDDLVVRTARDVFGPGWVLALYAVVERAIMERLGAASGLTCDDLPNPDMAPAAETVAMHTAQMVDDPPPAEATDGEGEDKEDEPSSLMNRWNARQRLIEDFRRGNCGEVARRHVTALIREALRRYSPEQLLPTVTIDEEDRPGASGPTRATDFLRSIMPRGSDSAPCPPAMTRLFTPEGQIHEKSRVARVHLWCPKALMSSDGELTVPEHPDVEVVPDGFGERDGDGGYRVQITRLDVTVDCEPTDLEIFADLGEQ
jgi:hypothetical protein